MYKLHSDKPIVHLKGINHVIMESMKKPENVNLLFADQHQAVLQTGMRRNPDGQITINHQIKQFKTAVLPTKRYFVNCHSITYDSRLCTMLDTSDDDNMDVD